MKTRFVKSDRPSEVEPAGVVGEGGAVAAREEVTPGGLGGGRFWGRWSVPVLILAVLLAHGTALKADFYMDDYDHILHRETGKIADGMHYGYRWVTSLAWDGIYAVFGASSAAFHALNILLHMAITVSVFRVGRRFFRRLLPTNQAEGSDRAALAGALLFATHPLLTEGVNYAQNASLQLVTLFTVWAVGCSLKFFDSAHPRWLLGVVGCLAASAFSKEVGLVYAGVSVIVIWATVGGREVMVLIRGHRGRLKWGLLAAGPVLAYFLWYGLRLASHAVHAPMWAENVFTQGRLFWSYVGLMLWPAGLCADHLVPFSGVGWTDPVSLGATLAVGGLGALLILGLRGSRFRALCLLGLVGLVPLLLRFFYINKELFVEYRAYPAMPWLALAAGFGFATLFQRHRKAAGLALMVIVGLGAAASSRRSSVWSDASRLALDNMAHYPNHIRARTQLQKAALNEGDWDRVLELRDESLRAFEAVTHHNNTPGQRRKYELSAPYRGYLCSEHFVALALTERDGSRSGLEHATAIVERHRHLHPELFNPKHPHYEIVEQIVDVQQILLEHGAEYDRRRQETPPRAAGDQAAN